MTVEDGPANVKARPTGGAVALVAVDERPAGCPDVLTPIRGEPVLTHAVRGLLAVVDRVVLAAPPDRSEAYSRAAGAPVHVLHCADPGTAARLAWSAGLLADAEVVLVHDPLRPFVPAEVIRAVVDAVRRGAPSAVPVEPVTDTIKAVDAGGTVTGTHDRAVLRVVQSPHAFRPDLLPATDLDDAWTVPGDPRGIRLTNPFDLAVLDALLDHPEGAP
ncbi:2-C-methyl-D-erythritol 4-phosphate cytidylyltransferase [Amycolatopsis arida]|uniref:2-C-methyl-D-erythritol 4-phosphate cytidylyltransferase n=1 Tax=Amycolatopsis arida TaxID=587909 RepID=A0A1I5R324_9PSEU|nr:2-C-methyl-D-erythritol 4-phosphate cytidylyltransferase [Amycolatopsis arida]TDX99054.1 2-C-methyl-D-erythritol 4-phosphate cytidylyltransferase [Amycolatopsis arida]SFP52760.1 2-C-methyl-D-erythritol 4-phosphate cytidylyltransferase [Amycolatopsis arida]